MKTLITFFVFGLLSQSAFALNLNCTMSMDGFDDYGFDGQFIVFQNLEATCKSFDKKKNSEDYYTVQIRGVGPGLILNYAEVFTVNCPLVRKSKVDEKGKLILGGALVRVSPMIGAQLGAFVGQRGAVCMLGGVGLGFGAGASVSRLKITKGYDYPNDSYLD